MLITITHTLPADAARADLAATLDAMSATAAETAAELFQATKALPFAQAPGDEDDQLFLLMNRGVELMWELSDLMERAAKPL
jgi:hypothetical protein